MAICTRKNFKGGEGLKKENEKKEKKGDIRILKGGKVRKNLENEKKEKQGGIMALAMAIALARALARATDDNQRTRFTQTTIYITLPPGWVNPRPKRRESRLSKPSHWRRWDPP